MTRLNHALVASFVVSALVVTVSSPAFGNILLNPGFESGAGADATDWTELTGPNGTTGRSTISPHTGSAHAYMEFDNLNNAPAGAAHFVEQNQPVGSIDNTLNYNLSFWAKVDSADFTGQDIFFQILWLDQDASHGGGVKGETLTQLIPLGISTTYQQFGLSDMDAPDGADSFLVRFQLSAGAVADIVQGLYVDDVVLEVVPEPASLAMLSLGGLMILRRRR